MGREHSGRNDTPCQCVTGQIGDFFTSDFNFRVAQRCVIILLALSQGHDRPKKQAPGRWSPGAQGVAGPWPIEIRRSGVGVGRRSHRPRTWWFTRSGRKRLTDRFRPLDRPTCPESNLLGSLPDRAIPIGSFLINGPGNTVAGTLPSGSNPRPGSGRRRSSALLPGAFPSARRPVRAVQIRTRSGPTQPPSPKSVNPTCEPNS